MVSSTFTRGHFGLAFGDPVAGPAEATKVAPAVELAPWGTTSLLGLAFILAWMATGLVTAFVLSRQGHDGRSTGALGFVFGPLFVPLAMEARKRRDEAEPVVVAPGRRGDGPVDVLVVLDRSPADAPSVLPLLGMLGPQLGRLALARVLDFESMQDERERAEAELELSCGSLFLCEHEPAVVLLAGKPCDAPREYAADNGYHLVVFVGRTRRGLLRGRSRRADGAGSRFSELLVAHVPPDEP